MQGLDCSLKVGMRVGAELIEVRRHKLVGVINEVGIPKTTAARNLPPHHSSQLRGSPPSLVLWCPAGGALSPYFPFIHPTEPSSLLLHSFESIEPPVCQALCTGHNATGLQKCKNEPDRQRPILCGASRIELQ